ncbi:MAG: tetraacyldisaccharide 4'-kinase, partial [Calditrichaeota bacterium]|nr:tetraacyldisaccharide 4'-kinase [Calditrichota bacterium]
MRIFESKLLGLPLLPLAWLYGLSVTAHETLYRHGVLKRERVGALVVSVGNVTVGGTGKTPFTAWLARELAARGAKVGIVSRGYGRKSRGLVVVSDGSRLLADVRQSGDEPRLLALKAPGVPVIVDENRARGCREAVRRFGCQILLLDDAFQHRRLHRDVDIVLVNA